MVPLPRSWYIDRDHFESEMAAVFGRAWLPALHGTKLTEPGSYAVAQVGGYDIVLIKDRNATIRAFHNVCQHRAHRLLDGAGRLKAVVTCPYHAWTYGLDGALRHAPRSNHVADFDRSCFGLRSIRTAMFAGFVFVCFDDHADDPSASLRELENLLLIDHPRLPVMREVRRREAMLQANWKTIVENYLECYHCDIAHPSFGNFDLSTWKHVAHKDWSRQGRVEQGLDDGDVGDDDMIGLSAWWQWPNIFWARALHAETFVAAFHEPIAPDQTRQIRIVYSASGQEDSELKRFNDLFDDVFQEDTSVVESVQRGLGSFGYRGGVLVEQAAARAGWSEHVVHRFQDLVRDAMEVRMVA